MLGNRNFLDSWPDSKTDYTLSHFIVILKCELLARTMHGHFNFFSLQSPCGLILLEHIFTTAHIQDVTSIDQLPALSVNVFKKNDIKHKHILTSTWKGCQGQNVLVEELDWQLALTGPHSGKLDTSILPLIAYK